MTKIFFSFLQLMAGGSVPGLAVRPWDVMVQQGAIAEKAGDYKTAIEQYKQALETQQPPQMGNLQRLILVDKLAGAYSDANRFAEADRQWHLALRLAEKLAKRDSILYGLIVASLAILPTEATNIADNVATLRNLVATKTHRPFNRNMVVIRITLIQLLTDQKEYSEAMQLLEETQASLDHTARADARAMYNLLAVGVRLRTLQQRFADAAVMGREAVRIAESVHGTEHPALLMPLNNLAVALTRGNNYRDARGTFQRAMSICEISGSQTLDCGRTAENYAIFLQRTGHKKEGKRLAIAAEETMHQSIIENGIGMTVAARQ